MRTLAMRVAGVLPALGPAALAGFMPIFFLPISVDAYVLPRTSLIVLAGCAAAAAAVWVPAVRLRALGPLGLPALGVATALLLATFFSVSPNLSLIGSYGRYESLPVRMSYLLVFCFSAWMLNSRPQRRLVISGFLAGCLIAASQALFEAVTGALQRPDGNLGNANLLGALLAMAIPIAAARALFRPAWALLLPLLGGALLVTNSRSGWLAAVSGCLALLPLLSRTRRSRSVLAGAALLLLAGGVLAALSSPLASINNDDGASRLRVWQDSIGMLAAHPLLGGGLDSQGLLLGRHLSGDWARGAIFDRIHELDLDLVATQGIVGLAAVTWFWAGWAWRSVGALFSRPVSDALREEELPGLVAAWVAYLVVASVNFDWAPVTAPVWLLGGVAWSAVRSTTPARPVAAQLSGRWALAIALPASLAALVVGIALGILPVVADLEYFRGDLATAVALDPLQPRYHRVLGENLIASGRLQSGVTELELAGRLGEYESNSFVKLGDAELALGDRTGAERAFRRALELNRFDFTARRRVSALDRGP